MAERRRMFVTPPVTAPPTAVAPVVAPASATAEHVHHENCDAARAAGVGTGAAGRTGVRPHLDRDGNGVGCE